MITLTYAKLTLENFNIDSLDEFKRYQVVEQSLRQLNNEYIYIDNSFVENWDLDKRRNVANDVIHAIKSGAITYGAFCDERVIGFSYLGTEFFGTDKQYVELKMFHVTEEFRNKGIGKAIFSLTCKDAKEAGAKKLYISAHSASLGRKLLINSSTKWNF